MGLKSPDKTIRFCFNGVSWDDKFDAPVPGGMADRLIAPILEHIESPYELVRFPKPGGVNVYYTHRRQIGPVPGNIRDREIGVFVSHGIADKGWRDDVGNSYEHIFVSGPGWSAKMVGRHCPVHRIVEVGYAKLDPLFTGPGGAPIRDARSDKIRVLWGPTHDGGEGPPAERRTGNSWRTTWWDRDQIVALLPDDTFEIIEAPHPRHRPDRSATFDEYRAADVVIADGGSTIYEAMALDLPVVFPDWILAANHMNAQQAGTFEFEIYSKGIGRHVTDPAQLAAVVVEAATEGITDAEMEFIEPILPRRYRGDSGRMHAAALDDIAQHAAATPFPPTFRMVSYRHRGGRTVSVPVGSKQHLTYATSGWWTAVSGQ